MSVDSKRTDAHRQADRIYSQKTIQFVMRFKKDDPSDQRRLEWLNKQSDKTAAVKCLIDKEMNNQVNH